MGDRIKLYNFLSRKVEEFNPIGETVGLYTCGPTVYDYVHIGNWRTFVFEDVLKRALTFNGSDVKHVMNITDIDDKIINKSRDQKIEISELTAKYEKAFFEDLEKLNIVKADKYPKATESIDLMIDLIKKLLDKGVAYRGEDGVYFAVDKFKDYGKLSGLEKRKLKKGARVDDDLYDKENWSDFALWKFGKEDEISWEAPLLNVLR
jgi:cysteinyl-tRNA synthetase